MPTDPNAHTFPLTYLTAEEAAAILKRKPATLKDWRYHGKGPKFYRLGYKEIGYKPEDLQTFVEGTAVEATRG